MDRHPPTILADTLQFQPAPNGKAMQVVVFERFRRLSDAGWIEQLEPIAIIDAAAVVYRRTTDGHG